MTTGGIQLKAKGHQGWPVTVTASKTQGRVFPRASEEAQPCGHLGLGLGPSRTWREYISVVMVICHGNLGY